MKAFRKDAIDLREWELEFIQRGEQTVLLSDLYAKGLIRYFPQTLDIDAPSYDYIFTSHNKGYVRSVRKQSAFSFQQIAIEDHNFVERALERSVGVMVAFEEFAERCATDVSTTSTHTELAVQWKCIEEEFIKIIPWFWVPYYISVENLLTNRVRDGLLRYKEEIEAVTDLHDALLSVTFPVKENEFQHEQEMFFGLVSYATDHLKFFTENEFRTRAEVYLARYSWVPTFLLTPARPLTYDSLVVRVQKACESGFSADYSMQQRSKQKMEEKAARILEIVRGDEALVQWITYARELGFALTAGVEHALVGCATLLPVLGIIAERIGVSLDETKYLLSDEIISALRGGVHIDPVLIRERASEYVMAVVDGEQSALFGERAGAIIAGIEEVLEKIDVGVEEIKGQVACKGTVKGRVCVALNPRDSDRLSEGEVLVCPMTNPDYVPAMKRSCAIVTDEGGLLSHAAIMSREFGKPCVIATKTATKILKDGDLVEVDAERGVVRIIERAMERGR